MTTPTYSIIRIRHHRTPRTTGCRWCGYTRKDHVTRWVPGHGWHTWAAPTKAQVLARMAVNCREARDTVANGSVTRADVAPH
jgi:hypothetical protein